jgi:2-haloacid dehalogenase
MIATGFRWASAGGAAFCGNGTPAAFAAEDDMNKIEPTVQACVFDAYGTLFDVNSAARQMRDILGEKWQPLADVWRTKQLQYTWLRSLMARHVDFWQVTGDALDFALASVKLDDPALRERLMELYLKLHAYPEVKDVLMQLKTDGKKLAILSNGSPRMLTAAVQSAGIDKLLDAVLSVEDVGIYKPHPSVYRMALERFKLSAAEMCFVSSNAWDAHAAKAFGFQVVWCNRFGQQRERIPEPPDAEIASLSELPDLVSV